MKIKLAALLVLFIQIPVSLNARANDLIGNLNGLRTANRVVVSLIWPEFSFRSAPAEEMLSRTKGVACSFSTTSHEKINDLVDIIKKAEILVDDKTVERYGVQSGMHFYAYADDKRTALGSIIFGGKPNGENPQIKGEIALPPAILIKKPMRANRSLQNDVYRWTDGVDVDFTNKRNPEICKLFPKYADQDRD